MHCPLSSDSAAFGTLVLRLAVGHLQGRPDRPRSDVVLRGGLVDEILAETAVSEIPVRLRDEVLIEPRARLMLLGPLARSDWDAVGLSSANRRLGPQIERRVPSERDGLRSSGRLLATDARCGELRSTVNLPSRRPLELSGIGNNEQS